VISLSRPIRKLVCCYWGHRFAVAGHRPSVRPVRHCVWINLYEKCTRCGHVQVKEITTTEAAVRHKYCGTFVLDDCQVERLYADKLPKPRLVNLESY
jgi:hypothetical protein